MADNRPYTSKETDAARGHWLIDENNGNMPDECWIANKFCGVFTAQNSGIINN